jgi:hypothetical protein
LVGHPFEAVLKAADAAMFTTVLRSRLLPAAFKIFPRGF